MIRKSFKIENGYSVYTEEKKYNYETALEILDKIENNDIASAEIKRDCIIIKKLIWQCPYCNHKNKILNYDEIPLSRIHDELFYQTSLFDDEDKVIEFIHNKDDEVLHQCGYCKELAVHFQKHTK